MEIQELEVLNLSQGEIQVYTVILQLGVCAIGEIHEKAGRERRTIYDILNKLLNKGLVTYTNEKGKKTYACAPPSKLKDELRKKKEEIKDLEKKLPKIFALYKETKPDVTFEVLRGKEGIKTVFEDMLNYKNIYAIGGGFYISKKLPYYWKHYNKRRIEKGVIWHNLARNELKSKKIPTLECVNIKFLPREFSGNPVVIVIYGNKVVNLSWEEDWFAFSIQNKKIAENYVKHHQVLWNTIAT